MKLETFSYLPPLTTQQVLRQVHYLLQQGLVPAIEYIEKPTARASSKRERLRTCSLRSRRVRRPTPGATSS